MLSGVAWPTLSEETCRMESIDRRRFLVQVEPRLPRWAWRARCRLTLRAR